MIVQLLKKRSDDERINTEHIFEMKVEKYTLTVFNVLNKENTIFKKLSLFVSIKALYLYGRGFYMFLFCSFVAQDYNRISLDERF